MGISGENLILNNVDHSIKVYRLKANGNCRLPKEESGKLVGQLKQAWILEVSVDKKSLITRMLSLEGFCLIVVSNKF